MCEGPPALTVFMSDDSIGYQRVFRSASLRWNDPRPKAKEPDWYYVRVTQHNGHMAWSSPIWVG